MDSIALLLNHGFDIRAEDSNTIQACVDEYNVEPGEDEDKLYVDNCSGGCPRMRWCGGKDKAWLKKAQKRRAKIEAKQLKLDEHRRKQCEFNERERKKDVELCVDPGGEQLDNACDDDGDYIPCTSSSYVEEEKSEFPQIRVRNGFKSFNPDVMEVLVVMESKFKVDGRKAPSLLAYIANRLFQQKWIVPEDETVKAAKDKDKMESKSWKVNHARSKASQM